MKYEERRADKQNLTALGRNFYITLGKTAFSETVILI
jgi:hypothetical protein